MLRFYLVKEIVDVKVNDVLFFVYLKVIMMKVFDFIIFGNVVLVFFNDFFNKYVDIFVELGINLNNGLGDLYVRIENLLKKVEIIVDIEVVYVKNFVIVMVNFEKGIINFYVLSDVIIDVLVFVVICIFGKMWNKDG